MSEGVPQGAVLRPTLFNIFCHDFYTAISLSTYSDDLDITILLPCMQQLMEIDTNIQKFTLYLLLQNILRISTGNSFISWTWSKYLSLDLDNGLNYTINKTCNIAYTRLFKTWPLINRKMSNMNAQGYKSRPLCSIERGDGSRWNIVITRTEI